MLTGAWQFSSQHVLEGERIHGTLGCPSSRKVSGFYFFSILDHISAILENISSRCSFSLALTGREASIFHLCTSDAPFKMAVPVIKHTHVLASKTMWVLKTIVMYLQFPIPLCVQAFSLSIIVNMFIVIYQYRWLYKEKHALHPKQLVLSFLKSWPKMNLSHQLLILLSTNIFSNLFRFEILFIEHFPSTISEIYWWCLHFFLCILQVSPLCIWIFITRRSTEKCTDIPIGGKWQHLQEHMSD